MTPAAEKAGKVLLHYLETSCEARYLCFVLPYRASERRFLFGPDVRFDSMLRTYEAIAVQQVSRLTYGESGGWK